MQLFSVNNVDTNLHINHSQNSQIQLIRNERMLKNIEAYISERWYVGVFTPKTFYTFK